MQNPHHPAPMKLEATLEAMELASNHHQQPDDLHTATIVSTVPARNADFNVLLGDIASSIAESIGISLGQPHQSSEKIPALTWLQNTVVASNGRPSPKLAALINECLGPQGEPTVALLAHKTVQLKHHVSSPGHHQVLSVFYLALEGLLTAELGRSGGTVAVAKLLVSEVFFKSLIACATCCVSALQDQTIEGFIQLLAQLDLSTFDCSKLIERFSRSIPNLPPLFQTHLATVEEWIVEDIAWKSTRNGLYTALAAAIGGLDSSPESCQVPACLSFLEKSTAAGMSQQHSKHVAFTAVTQFSKKLFRISTERLSRWTSQLNLPTEQALEVTKEACSIAQKVLINHTWLVYGRHLDQILLCCLYGVCKAMKIDTASFKTIIAAYKSQALTAIMSNRNTAAVAADGVYTLVPLGPVCVHGLELVAPGSIAGEWTAFIPLVNFGLNNNNTTGDIIAFYNELFLPAVKPLLQSLTPIIRANAGMSPGGFAGFSPTRRYSGGEMYPSSVVGKLLLSTSSPLNSPLLLRSPIHRQQHSQGCTTGTNPSQHLLLPKTTLTQKQQQQTATSDNNNYYTSTPTRAAGSSTNSCMLTQSKRLSPGRWKMQGPRSTLTGTAPLPNWKPILPGGKRQQHGTNNNNNYSSSAFASSSEGEPDHPSTGPVKDRSAKKRGSSSGVGAGATAAFKKRHASSHGANAVDISFNGGGSSGDVSVSEDMYEDYNGGEHYQQASGQQGVNGVNVQQQPAQDNFMLLAAAAAAAQDDDATMN